MGYTGRLAAACGEPGDGFGAMLGSIKVRPDPAPAGGEVEVEFDGTPPLYYGDLVSGEFKEVPLDPTTGKARVRVPTGPQVLLFFDKNEPRSSKGVEIVDPSTTGGATKSWD